MENAMGNVTRHLKFYVDGALAGSTTIGGGTPYFDPFSVGHTNSFPNAFFVGSWDDLRVYDRTLSDAEVALLARWS